MSIEQVWTLAQCGWALAATFLIGCIAMTIHCGRVLNRWGESNDRWHHFSRELIEKLERQEHERTEASK